MKPMAVELFAGTGSATAPWCELGGRAVCFDLEYLPHHGKPHERQERVIQDVLTLHGSQFKDAAFIWGSPPCQNYSYLAMPWSRSKDPENSKAAKALRKKWETEGADNRLFDACFRIQREAMEAFCHCACPRCSRGGHCVRCDCHQNTGKYPRYIPLIVENVRGAVPWVGREAAKFGSFYLWGDVAQIGNRVIAGRDLADIRAGRGRLGMGVVPIREGDKMPGLSLNPGADKWRPEDGQKRNPDGTAHPQGSWFRIADSSQGDRGRKVPAFRFDGSGRSFQTASVEATEGNKGTGKYPNRGWTAGTAISLGLENYAGVKVPGQIQGKEYAMCRTGAAGQTSLSTREGKKVETEGPGGWFGGQRSHPLRTCSSKRNARKAASALIAKIPYALARYVAEQHYPPSALERTA